MSNPNPPSGGPPLRALAMVLIAVAIVFAGLGAMSLSSSSDSDTSAGPGSSSSTTPAPATPARPAATSSTAALTTTTTAATATTAANGVDKSIPVRVLNNSTIAGLAAKTGSRLTASGWNVTETGNYSSSVLSKTTVFYENSREQATAQAIADQLGGRIEPRSAGLGGSAPGIIVIVAND
ncbi:LytR C-terminal domain-containing protein [Nocardia sp. NEAU-G5]|uniref:LytR C-terminal domain-containing protein n=1 Tax=Nocardia albiluteola TaxID=2842303 RepID=A0ABS6BA54_9NOCA|nr:LytR C-terminal domain-containing protein [Nocardia albiluteola]MBU3066044.1 LytR C-terminal domain-containing protein [Nocardia albiluteola]